jgi:predicted GNAT family acetyltransferase
MEALPMPAQDALSSGPDADVVSDNPGRQRFELLVEGQIAFAEYQRRPGLLLITHVETPPALRGGGVAGRLMKGMLEIIRERGIKAAPLCPYAEAYIRRHPEYQDLIG